MPTMAPAAGSRAGGGGGATHGARAQQLPGVAMHALQQFLFPSTQENPDAVGRLELFAKYGPSDEDGFLRGGVSGAHIHSDDEIKVMIEHNCRETMYSLFRKPRDTVESMVDTLTPLALAQKYTPADVKRVLKGVPTETNGRMDFSTLQRTILESQRQRLMILVRRAEGGKPLAPPAERLPRVPFQSKSAATLMEITTRKKYTDVQAEINYSKRLHSYSGLIASLEDQGQTAQLKANALLVRGPGDVNDRFDRYCAVRRTGRASYVQARNEPLFNASMDDGLANKYPGCSSLLVATAKGSSAGALIDN